MCLPRLVASTYGKFGLAENVSRSPLRQTKGIKLQGHTKQKGVRSCTRRLLRGVQSLDYLEQASHPDPTHSLVARFGINTNHAVQLSGRLNGGDRSVALLARRERRRRGEEGSGDDNLHGRYLYSLDGRRTESISRGWKAGLGFWHLAYVEDREG